MRSLVLLPLPSKVMLSTPAMAGELFVEGFFQALAAFEVGPEQFVGLERAVGLAAGLAAVADDVRGHGAVGIAAQVDGAQGRGRARRVELACGRFPLPRA